MLFDEISDDIVNWWDRYSKISRKVDKDTKLDVGRFGERLSLEYERNRTKKEPTWKGFETNLAGFDVLSVIDELNPSPLYIEVKTSNSSVSVANFFVTRHEWEVASTSKNYIFHLWVLQPKPKLFIVPFNEVDKHIPKDFGDGEWENARLPFASFVTVSHQSIP